MVTTAGEKYPLGWHQGAHCWGCVDCENLHPRLLPAEQALGKRVQCCSHRSHGSLFLMDFACMYKIDLKTAKSSLCSTYIHKRPVQSSGSSLPVSNLRLFSNNALFRVIIGVRCIVSGWLLLSYYTVLRQLSYHSYL